MSPVVRTIVDFRNKMREFTGIGHPIAAIAVDTYVMRQLKMAMADLEGRPDLWLQGTFNDMSVCGIRINEQSTL